MFHPSVHDRISNYNKVSATHINWTNSKILPLTQFNWNAEVRDFRYKIAKQSITDFGIHILARLNDLYTLHYILVLEESGKMK